MRIAGRMKAEGSWGPEEDSLARVAQAERGALCRLCSSVPRKDSVAAAEGEVPVGRTSVTFSWQTV